jgi:23S rRNA pseudouridine2605 synthase
VTRESKHRAANSASNANIPVETSISQRQVGLARALSKLGYCSRSRAVELIRSGRVRINGAVRTNVETPVHLGKDRLEIDGQGVAETKKIYLMLNKPRGVVTTASDERGRATVYDCLGKDFAWVAPVGRLDKASEGLLLLTNDSEWAAGITTPGNHVDKVYHVQVARLVTAKDLESLQHGVALKGGEFLRVKSAALLRAGDRNCWVEIILDEGRNRHIRRMFEALGVEVLRLIRVAIGALKLGDLAKGATRELTAEERVLLFTKTSIV